ncbi:hypothetical protein GGS20DRAFT_428246 [Poronia punctata]|nr:hypothetical protein GGS20DRAFT_428246 [Poronia punctata]
MSNLGPLPTDFLESSGCETVLDGLYWAENNYYLQGQPEQTLCFPSGYVAKPEQYYSPALCPSGYTQACVSTNRVGKISETVVTCCPTQDVYECQSTHTLAWETTLGCVSQITEQVVLTAMVVQDGSTRLRTETNDIGAIGAYPIKVRYKSTDFVSSTSSSTSTSSSSSTSTPHSPINPITTSNSPIQPSNENDDDDNKGINVGAAVGITIGAIAGIILLIAAIWYMIRRRKRRNHQVIPLSSDPDYHHPTTYYGPDNKFNNSYPLSDHQQYYNHPEIPSGDPPRELQGTSPVHELPSSHR